MGAVDQISKSKGMYVSMCYCCVGSIQGIEKWPLDDGAKESEKRQGE